MVKVEVTQLSKSYGAREVLSEISFHVERGEWFCILGPNGSGKSTLLHTISGVERPTAGEVHLDDRPVQRIQRKALAKSLAVLHQDALPPLGFTVREVIEMGRYPFQNWLGREPGEDDEQMVERILDWLKLRPMEGRTVDALSGGERQRVALGKAMAQEPKLLLLDEPTTFLDIGYQVDMMDRIRKWQQECGLTVISVLHDLNLAAQYCDRLMLLQSGSIVGIGKPEDVMEAGLLERVYGTRPYVMAHPDNGAPQILLGRGDV
ncbi:Iron(3+)-hydroxamate import ATP-binding protein FhuC [Paenibacillus solanacearum]|uniref:Iron(3+)-hydroxamate import ATP-binding protein FhuC n=1 Tax=Paenibacillus solanacearum TaxID=2048548 RepID=A0A916NW40_9BACL|nr:ABC transporter ATP-binding protein [Paenibacillus solanacearum]CAG7613836.1 Iron(3+)-hydroxamate import ATP-binding protein FhuC [Paenibacillus solanacearum]